MTTPNTTNKEIARAVRLALLVSSVPLVTTGPVALAQEDEGAVVEEIVVTGSRIPQRNLVSSSPVTTVNAAEVQFQGVTRIEDLLNNLPQVSPTQASGQANGASGTATVDLRGLEPERTLVLINGRRLPAGSPNGSSGLATDLNQIPAALIDRIEVLTGGASAAYGSDAVAGVVNFITKTDFEGFQLDYQYSWYTHKNDNGIAQASRDAGFTLPAEDVSDGFNTDVSITMGMNSGDGRGNVTAYATYREIDEILQGSRDFSNCALDGPAGGLACAGSQTLPQGNFTDFGTVSPSFDFITQGDQFVDRNGLLYNFAPSNHFQRPDERVIAGAIGTYNFSDRLEIFAELSYMDDKSVAQIAPSGAFFVTTSLPCGNPLLSQQQFDAVCGSFGLTTADSQSVFIGRRNVEGGNRQDTLRHTSNRVVLGARGDVGNNWTYESYVNFAEVTFSQTYLNDLSTTRIIRALDVIADPNTGAPVCRSVIDGSDPACVPWNVFQEGGVGGPGSAIQNYLSVPLFATGETSTAVFNGYVTGDLTDYGLQLPNTDSGIQVVGGYEFRQEKLTFTPDIGFGSGDGAGQGGPVQGVQGDFDVNEFFAEVYVPIVEGLDAAQSINLNLGYRYSDYSTDQDTDTYKAAFDWSINDSVKLRASFQRAVRAGNLQDLFRPAVIGLFDMDIDPCATATPLRTLEECMRTGVTAAQYGNIADSPAGQFNEITGGNTALIPESSDTLSFGGVFTPAFLDGLVVSIDYYEIEIEDAIDNISSSFILDQCLDTGEAFWCDPINRGATTGTLWIGQDSIRSTDINIGSLTREGIDLQVGYGFDIGEYGGLDFNLVGTYVLAAEEVPFPGAPTIVCEGKWDAGNCGSPTPEWAHTFRATWATPWDADVSLFWRYVGEVDDLGNNAINFGRQNWVDLAATWQATDNVLLRLGINNVADRDPPLSGDPGPSVFGNGNTFPGVYDTNGRYWFAGVSLSL